jgi:hypothetical protein
VSDLTWRWAAPDAVPVAGSLFQTARWFEVKQPGGRHRVAECLRDGRRVGGMGVREVRTAGLVRRYELMAEPAVEAGADLDQAAALSAFLGFARREGADLVESFSNMARWTHPDLPAVLAGSETEPFGTYRVDLSRGVDALRAGMHSEHRRLLRKAEAAGILVRPMLPADAFIDLMDETYGRGGKDRPFDEGYLRRLIDARDTLDLLLFSAWSGDTLEAAAIIPFDRGRGYYLHGASRTHAAQGATVAVQMAAMTALAARGVGVYDLGGARRETTDERLRGIFRFKERVGGVFEDCVRWRCALTAVGRGGLALAHRRGARCGVRGPPRRGPLSRACPPGRPTRRPASRVRRGGRSRSGAGSRARG